MFDSICVHAHGIDICDKNDNFSFFVLRTQSNALIVVLFLSLEKSYFCNAIIITIFWLYEISISHKHYHFVIFLIFHFIMSYLWSCWGAVRWSFQYREDYQTNWVPGLTFYCYFTCNFLFPKSWVVDSHSSKCLEFSKVNFTSLVKKNCVFQVNGIDLAEVAGGEVAITNMHSCNGPDFIVQLHFSLRQASATANSPGSDCSFFLLLRLAMAYNLSSECHLWIISFPKSWNMSGSRPSKEANARLKFVYFPVTEVCAISAPTFSAHLVPKKKKKSALGKVLKVYTTGGRKHRDNYG